MNKIGTEPIETKRLILRRFTTDDAEDMFNNWASDPEVTRFLTWPTHAVRFCEKEEYLTHSEHLMIVSVKG